MVKMSELKKDRETEIKQLIDIVKAEEENPIDAFLHSVGISMKKLPPAKQCELKVKILEAVSKAELNQESPEVVHPPSRFFLAFRNT